MIAATDNATLAATCAAAVAAIASWAAVWQAGRWQRRQREPWLHIQVSQDLGSGRIGVRVDNAGGGIAQEAVFWVCEGAHACTTGLPPYGSLAPGRSVSMLTRLQATPGTHHSFAAVICRSGPRIHAWDAGNRHKSWRLNKWAFPKPGSSEAIVHRFYPDTPAIEDLRLVGYTNVQTD
jgi:hypothetical protein